MNLKDKLNVPSGSSLMLYSSNIVSVVYVDLCVVSLFLLLGNIDSASAAIFFSPRIYSISGPFSSNISLHCNALSLLKFLHVKIYWSVYIFIC